MSKAETKFNNTALKMNKAMFELIDEKEFKDITVTDICKKANVNRSTFYAHYDTPQDLLIEAKENFIAEFFNGYNLKAQQISRLSKDETNFITEEYLLPYLKFIKKNRKIYKIFIENIKSFNPDNIENMLLKAVFIPIYKKHNITDETIVSYLARYYLNGITSVINLWIERNCIDDYKLICEIIIMGVRPNDRN